MYNSTLVAVGKCLRAVVVAIDRTSSVLGWVGTYLVGGIAVVMIYEVFVRYVLNKPTSWSLEVAELMQVTLAYIVASYVLKEGGHVSMTVVIDRFAGKVRNWLLMVSSIISALACAPVIYLSWVTFQVSSSTGERSFNTQIPVYPFKLLVCIGFFLLAIQFLAGAYRCYRLACGSHGEGLRGDI